MCFFSGVQCQLYKVTDENYYLKLYSLAHVCFALKESLPFLILISDMVVGYARYPFLVSRGVLRNWMYIRSYDDNISLMIYFRRSPLPHTSYDKPKFN